MKMEGTVMLARALAGHKLWTSGQFDPGKAWADLLMLANDQSNREFLNERFVDIPRGTLAWSERKLMDRWKWTRHKVNNFLNMLQREGMINRTKDGRLGLTSIVNYDLYNPQTTADQPDSDHTSTTTQPEICLEGGKERKGNGNDQVPTEDQVSEFARTYPGDMARGIPAQIPDQWALNWFAWRADPCRPFPHDWQGDFIRRFRADWVNGDARARGEVRNGSAQKRAELSPNMTAIEIEKIERELRHHAGNPLGGMTPLEHQREEYQALEQRLRSLKGQA